MYDAGTEFWLVNWIRQIYECIISKRNSDFLHPYPPHKWKNFFRLFVDVLSNNEAEMIVSKMLRRIFKLSDRKTQI